MNFSAEADPRREPISNTSNLKKGFCHRSYTLRRKGLNGLSFILNLYRVGLLRGREKVAC